MKIKRFNEEHRLPKIKNQYDRNTIEDITEEENELKTLADRVSKLEKDMNNFTIEIYGNKKDFYDR